MKHILLITLCVLSLSASAQVQTEKRDSLRGTGLAISSNTLDWTKIKEPKFEALRYHPFDKKDSLSCFVCKQAFKLGDSFVYYVVSQSSTNEIVAQFAHPKCAERHPRYKH